MSGKLTKQFKERMITKFKEFINHHEREYDWIEYLAVDKNGLIFGYEKNPMKCFNAWASYERHVRINDCSMEFDSTRWTNTLIKIDWEEISKETSEDKKYMKWIKDPTSARVEELVSPSGRFKFIVAPYERDLKAYAVYISHKDDWINRRCVRTFSDMEKAKSFVEDLIKEIKTME